MVRNRRGVTAAGCAIVLGLVLMAASSRASMANHTTILTFSGPVSLPGVTLGRGTYVFELADPDILDVVRVTSQDRKLTYFMGFTRRVDRPAGLDAGRLVSLGESRPGVPPPILAWYPVDSIGHQFIYRDATR